MKTKLNEYQSSDKTITGIKKLKKLKKQSPGKKYFIHFTKVPKIGVNPKKSHKDPYGIYFYPDNFVLNVENWNVFQYALNFDYYYIVTLKPDTNLLYTKDITIETIKNILSEKLYKLFDLIKKDFGGTLNKKFFSFLDMLNADPKERNNEAHKKIPKITWNKIFKNTNYDGIYDTKGLIAKEEPKQLVIFHINKINVEDFGKNYFDYSENHKILKNLVDKYNYPYDFAKFVNNEYVIGNEYYILKKEEGHEVIYYYLDENQILRTKKFYPRYLDDYGMSLIDLEIFIKNLNIKDLKYKLKNSKKQPKNKWENYFDNVINSLIKRFPRNEEIETLEEQDLRLFQKIVEVEGEEYLFYLKLDLTEFTLFIYKPSEGDSSKVSVSFKMGDQPVKNVSKFRRQVKQKYGNELYVKIFKSIRNS